MSARPRYADAFQTRIFCTRCRATCGAFKVRREGGWANRCTVCGELHAAPPPADGRRALVRKAQRIERRLERGGQLRLFPSTPKTKGDR